MEHSLYDVDKEARFQNVYDSYMQDVYRLCFSYMKIRWTRRMPCRKLLPLLSGNGARERGRTRKRVAPCHSRKCLQKYFETLVAEKSKLAGK